MILDRVENADRYAPLHPRFPAALRHLRKADLAALADGEHEIDGRRLYVSVTSTVGRGRAEARLEAHRRYIDIHVVIDGSDEIGLRAVADCHDVEVAYDEGRDCTLFRDRPETWVTIPPGSFAILFPGEGHAPLATAGHLRKAVVKVRIDD